ncbi:signal peptidase I [Pseudonocardia sulfidoxydans]|uniref:signal peptidase I n=1 Tax=Pseudonocardia sulfidoxydans TaxID=54011 RepID=UPI0027D9C768|nr:signal peptidase I [Pseudonocardia sulfidoxydans]
MALPELPDDRRAQPRRYGPANPAPPPPGEGRVPADERWAPNGGPDAGVAGGPGRHAPRQAPGRTPDEWAPEAAPRHGQNGRPDNPGRSPQGYDGRASARRGPGHGSPGADAPGYDARGAEVRNVDASGGDDLDRTMPQRPTGPPPTGPRRQPPGDPRRNGRADRPAAARPPAHDRVVPDDVLAGPGDAALDETVDLGRAPRALRRDEPLREDRPRRSAREQRPTGERRVRDTTDGVSDSLETGAVPGRHRRRAGESPEGRPASSYSGDTKPGGGKQKSGRRRKTSFWKELPLLIVVALLLTFLIQTFLAKVYVIPSGSMEQTLHGCTGCNNDRVLVDKITYRFSDPTPGDVVVFRGPDSWGTEQVSVPSSALARGLQQVGSLIGLAPPDEKDFVKRVIAVGGQTVACCDSRNRVMVNGKPLDEPYIYYLPEAGPARQVPFGPVTVPQGELWMMGDSRNNSSDSRAAGHGPVPVENVIGKARLKVLPFDRFGIIHAPDPQSAEPVGMGGPEGPPLALGLLGTLPLAIDRRRRSRSSGVDDIDDFLPSPRRRLPRPWRR